MSDFLYGLLSLFLVILGLSLLRALSRALFERGDE